MMLFISLLKTSRMLGSFPLCMSDHECASIFFHFICLAMSPLLSSSTKHDWSWSVSDFFSFMSDYKHTPAFFHFMYFMYLIISFLRFICLTMSALLSFFIEHVWLWAHVCLFPLSMFHHEQSFYFTVHMEFVLYMWNLLSVNTWIKLDWIKTHSF